MYQSKMSQVLFFKFQKKGKTYFLKTVTLKNMQKITVITKNLSNQQIIWIKF